MEDIEICYPQLRPEQIVNHYLRNYELISKHGIARNMRALPSFEDTDIDEIVPRSYYTYDPNQFREFLNGLPPHKDVLVVGHAGFFKRLFGEDQKMKNCEVVTRGLDGGAVAAG